MIESFTADTFSPHVNGAFAVHPGPQGPIELVLDSVERWGPEPDAGADRRQPFTLTWTGPPAPVLEQRIYRFEHPVIGGFEIFIVPVAAGATAATYEAVFT